MDGNSPEDPALERALRGLMLAVVYGSTIGLLAGLVVWLFRRESDTPAMLLNGALIVLMAAPAVRVLISAVEAVRQKEWLHLATIAAVAILLGVAVTIASRS